MHNKEHHSTQLHSAYQTRVVYPAALEEAYSVMVDMKRRIEHYKLKANANQQWIDKQEQALAKLMYFIETSRETFELLESEYGKAKAEGFRKGVEQANFKHQREKDFGNLEFDRPAHREQIRAATILNAQEKWNI